MSYIYWCQLCDSNQVDSSNKKTGSFYIVGGHEVKGDNYTAVRFAICKDCDVHQYLTDAKKNNELLEMIPNPEPVLEDWISKRKGTQAK